MYIEKKKIAVSCRFTITSEKGIKPSIADKTNLFIIDIFDKHITKKILTPQIKNKKHAISPKSTINAGRPVGLTLPPVLPP